MAHHSHRQPVPAERADLAAIAALPGVVCRRSMTRRCPKRPPTWSRPTCSGGSCPTATSRGPRGSGGWREQAPASRISTSRDSRKRHHGDERERPARVVDGRVRPWRDPVRFPAACRTAGSPAPPRVGPGCRRGRTPSAGERLRSSGTARSGARSRGWRRPSGCACCAVKLRPEQRDRRWLRARRRRRPGGSDPGADRRARRVARRPRRGRRGGDRAAADAPRPGASSAATRSPR